MHRHLDEAGGMSRSDLGPLAALGFLLAIVMANIATTRWGFVPVPFGLEATAGTYFAGLVFVLRDAVQDTLGRAWVFGLILGGAVLSFALAAPTIALASAVAFAVSETADWAVYQPLRERGYLRAAVASNVAGALVDTWLFLYLAGFPIWGSMAGQLVGKLTMTAAVVAGVICWRAVSGQPHQ